MIETTILLLLVFWPRPGSAQCSVSYTCGAEMGSGSQSFSNRDECLAKYNEVKATESGSGCSYDENCACPATNAAPSPPSDAATREAARKARDEQRRAEKESERRRQEFDREKEEALRALKGTDQAQPGLKEESPPAEPNLKLKDGDAGMDVRTAAWQQRQCATELTNQARKTLRDKKRPIDVERLRALKSRTLAVLTGKDLKAECSIKAMLDLGDRQPGNAGWVARFTAELDGIIAQADALNSGRKRPAN